MPTDIRLLLPVPEACKALGGVCPRTLWSLTQPRGPIPSVRIGSRVLYAVTDLQTAIERMRGAQADE